MRRILGLFLLLLLSACSNVGISKIPIAVNTQVIPTNTSLASTSHPTITITPTAKTPCDPFSADYCIADGHFIFQRPIHPPANDLVDETYLYGSTADGRREPHHGVEFPNQSGTPVYAAADGSVSFAGPDEEAVYCPWPKFYGNLIVLQHKDGLFTLYAHLSKIDVEAGQMVKAGTQIGEVGRTGVAIGSHLHFEVRRGNVRDYFATQDPQLWLIPAKDTNGRPFGTLMVSVLDENHKLVKYAKYTIRSSPAQSQKDVKSYYGTTYSADMLNGDENAVLGELPAGHYRIAIERNGKVYERRVEVESGKLTQVVFIVK
jgi:murein DD-endopeptidase MepM/ murein hydrolase activator NlpD